MYNIAVLGDRDSVSPFIAVGFDVFEIYDGKSAKLKIRELYEKEYGIIFITEKLAFEIKSEIEKYKDLLYPSIVLIPGTTGNTNEGMDNLLSSVKKAVGKNIL